MATEQPKPENDYPAALGAQQRLSHNRFFEDGEEPPDRYDLEDELDYILPPPVAWDARRWFAVAWRLFQANWQELTVGSSPYVIVLGLVAFSSCGTLVLVFEPLMCIIPLAASIDVLTGNNRGHWGYLRARQVRWRLIGCRLPISGCWLATFGLILFGSEFVDRSFSPPWSSLVISVTILACTIGCLVLHVRLCGFAIELVCDHDLGLIQAFRGSWRLTRGYSVRFIALKLFLWLFVIVAGLGTLGIGFLFAIPFASLVWTTIYVDVAGSAGLPEAAECPPS